MNNQDLLKGFQQCASEIKELRSINRELAIEVNAMNRVLEAVNSHSPQRTNRGESEDIIFQIRKTTEFLEKEIAKEKRS